MSEQTKKEGGTITAETPVVVGLLPGGRLTYEQLKVTKSITVTLADIADKGPEGGISIRLVRYLPGEDPDYGVELAKKLKVDQPTGDWVFPVVFADIDTSGFIDEGNPLNTPTEYLLAFQSFDLFDNPDTSNPPLSVFADLTAPCQTAPDMGQGVGPRPLQLAPPTGFPSIVNEAWLAANPGGVTVTLPPYVLAQPDDDSCGFWISNQSTFPLMQADPQARAYNGPVNAARTFNIPLSFFENLADGPYRYAYNLRDLPLNISNNCNLTNIFTVSRAPAPVLGIPRIPVTGADRLTPILLSTVSTPPATRAVMEIDIPLNAIPNVDRILPFVQSANTLTPVGLSEQLVPTTPGPMRFPLEYDPPLSELFGDPDGQDEVSFQYWFVVIRGTTTYPPSSRVSGIVDFSYAGPVQPNLPDLENPNIDPVVVRGSGTPQSPDNSLLAPADSDRSATMIYTLWNDPGRPITGRELVTFYYNNLQVGAPVPVLTGDTEVFRSLPWESIRVAGNGTVAGGDAKEAYVTVSYADTGNVMRQQVATLVNVTAIVINLPPPQVILSATANTPEGIATVINCRSLNHPVTPNTNPPPYQPRNLLIRIPADSNNPPGTTVNLTFEGRTTNAPGAPLIPDTTITRTGQMPPAGPLEFRLDEYDTIRNIQLPPTGTTRPATRYARIFYTAAGVTAEVTLPVSLLNNSLVYCEVERP